MTFGTYLLTLGSYILAMKGCEVQASTSRKTKQQTSLPINVKLCPLVDGALTTRGLLVDPGARRQSCAPWDFS